MRKKDALPSKSVLGMSMMLGSEILYLGLQKEEQAIDIIYFLQVWDSLGHTRKRAASTG